MKVDLPDGQWAVFRDDLDDMTNGEIRPVRTAAAQMIYGADEAKGTDVVSADEAILKLLISEWSFPLPVPAEQPDALDQIKAKYYNALAREVQPYFKKVVGNEDGPQEVDPTPGSPTSPSDRSQPTSEADLSTGSTSPTKTGSSTSVAPASVGAGPTT